MFRASKQNNMLTRFLIIAMCWYWLIGQALVACPFCPALEPTWSEKLAEQTVVLVGEAQTTTTISEQSFLVHQSLKAPPNFVRPATVKLQLTKPCDVGKLVLLLGNRAEQTEWQAQQMSEVFLAYLAKQPAASKSIRERLAYYAKYLEHAETEIASDAIQEFARAEYQEVQQNLDLFTIKQLRKWLTDKVVPVAHRGFYAMLLGSKTKLLEPAKERTEIQTQKQFLRELATADESDFRAGMDGIYAGYVLAVGPTAITELHDQITIKAEPAIGKLRHWASTLRFLQEFGPAAWRKNVEQHYAKLLSYPNIAATTITDLARWQQWQELETVANWYSRAETDAVIQRAVIGYLRTCPHPTAATRLAELKQRDPTGVAQHERFFEQLRQRAN
jgi:hypothetical protein